jgi:hypothetical protein
VFVYAPDPAMRRVFYWLQQNGGEVQTGRTPVSKAGCSGFDARHPRHLCGSEGEVNSHASHKRRVDGLSPSAATNVSEYV